MEWTSRLSFIFSQMISGNDYVLENAISYFIDITLSLAEE